MDFQARFKGRTNFVTREGISSLITGASTPIAKQGPSSGFNTPKPSSKTQNNTPSHEEHAGSSMSPTQKRSLHASLYRTPRTEHRQDEVIEQNWKPSNMALKIQTDPYFYNNEEKPGATPKSYYATPQSRFFPKGEPVSAGSMPLSSRAMEIKQMVQFKAQSEPYLNRDYSLSEQRQKPILDSSIMYGGSSMYKSTSRQSEMMNHNSQEERIARMGFVERQEKVLNRYKKK